jgi:hypothetical protein
VVSWQALREHGVVDGTPLRLDFFYIAPNRAAAESLASALDGQDGYTAQVSGQRHGLRRTWTVVGATPTIPMTHDRLDDWVGEMIEAGMDHGDCDFDGWGAETP